MATKKQTKQDTPNDTMALAQREATNATTAAQQVLAAAEALVVQDSDTAASAAAFIKRIKSVRDEADRARKSITAPLDAAKKAAMALFKPGFDVCDAAEAKARGKLVAYERVREEEERRAREAAEAAQREAEAKLAKAKSAKAIAAAQEQLAEAAESKALATVQFAAPAAAGVSFRLLPRGEVTDAAVLPREYLMPDVTKLIEATKLAGGDPNIAGWRGWMDKSTVIR